MLTASQQSFFHQHGYLVLENIVAQQYLLSLQEEANMLIHTLVSTDQDLIETYGCILEPMGRLLTRPFDAATKKSYCRTRNARWNPAVTEFLFSSFYEMVSSLMGPQVFLFNEQYIIKPPHSTSTAFNFHQDGEYLEDAEDAFFVSCWINLDDVTEVLSRHERHGLSFGHCHGQSPLL